MAAHSDAEIDAAIEALSDPARMEQAQRLVASRAPQLQRILDQALESADWFGSAHQAEVLKAAGRADADERVDAVRALIAEETRVSMLIGVAVGYELAQTLMKGDS
jgi:acyl-CoA reductase-like NAD-dependent aldehyde dehydrogenase